ncbi:MAG: glycosyltransferase family 2 protein, partial [Flavobacterium sp.]
NAHKTLEKCIKSVIKQTFKEWELILIDDCSEDKSLEIIKKYSKIDHRIKYIQKEQNIQSLLARIDGINIATGDFITFLDADDWFYKNALQSLYQNSIETNADVVLGAWRRTFDNYGIFKTKPLNIYYNKLIEGVYNKEKMEELFGYSFFSNHRLPVINWAKLYKKELFNDLSYYNVPKILKGTDLYLNLIIFPKITKISFIKDLTVIYRDGGISQKITPNYLENVNEIYLLRKKLLENSSKKEQAYFYMNKELANTFYFYLVDCVYIEKINVEQIKTKFLEFKNNISYQDFISNLNQNDFLHYDFYNSLENGNFEKVYQLINEKIAKFRFKRGLRKFIGNILLKF